MRGSGPPQTMLMRFCAGHAAPSGTGTAYQNGGCGRCAGVISIGTFSKW